MYFIAVRLSWGKGGRLALGRRKKDGGGQEIVSRIFERKE
jgi:hypothetical protein